jgi:hypothetical protein
MQKAGDRINTLLAGSSRKNLHKIEEHTVKQ